MSPNPNYKSTGQMLEYVLQEMPRSFDLELMKIMKPISLENDQRMLSQQTSSIIPNLNIRTRVLRREKIFFPTLDRQFTILKKRRRKEILETGSLKQEERIYCTSSCILSGLYCSPSKSCFCLTTASV